MQPNYEGIYTYIKDLYKLKLPKFLKYHNWNHTYNVINTTEELAISEGFSPSEIVLLKTAALLHDSGFLFEYFKNEVLGAEFAQKELPNFAYQLHDIQIISSLIQATQFPSNPKNKAEAIICDADLYYVGGTNFKSQANKLKTEFLYKKIITTEKEWLKLQVSFLKSHKFHTETAKNKCYKNWKINLEEAEKDLALFEQNN